MLRMGTIVTKVMIMNHLYPGTKGPELKVIDVFVCRLRKKVSALSGGNPLIDTIWGRGFLIHDNPDVPDKANQTVKQMMPE